MYLVAAAIFTILIAYFLVLPHLDKSAVAHGAPENFDLQGLLDERERVLRTIKDLELDFQMGKISVDDHAVLKGRSAEELARILARLDGVRKG